MVRWAVLPALVSAIGLSACQSRDEIMAAPDPSPFRQTVKALVESWDEENRERFAATPYNELINYYMTVGMYVRNEYVRRGEFGVAGWLQERGVRQIDQMGSLILTAAWFELNGCDIDLNDPFLDRTENQPVTAEDGTNYIVLPRLPHASEICPPSAPIGQPLGFGEAALAITTDGDTP